MKSTMPAAFLLGALFTHSAQAAIMDCDVSNALNDALETFTLTVDRNTRHAVLDGFIETDISGWSATFSVAARPDEGERADGRLSLIPPSSAATRPSLGLPIRAQFDLPEASNELAVTVAVALDKGEIVSPMQIVCPVLQ